MAFSADPESGEGTKDASTTCRPDAVLERVARLLAENVRKEDRLARYGGEEFVVAMPGAGLAEATEAAERLRQAIFDHTPTTVSIGCAARQGNEPAIDVLRRADDLLLTAKRTGKNSVRSRKLRKSARPSAAA